MIVTSEIQTSGGTAAESKSPTPNNSQHMHSQTKEPQSGNELVTLKPAAAKFDCAASSLKNNIKTGKLAATQVNEKAPYMVRLSDVERFLRDTPGIASIFHPAGDKAAGAMTAQTAGPASIEPAKLDKAQDKKSSATEASVMQPSRAHAAVAADSAKPANQAADHSQLTHGPDAQSEPSTHTAADGLKRRRRRRRGKGGGESPTTAGIQPPVLKALAGTTPKERLRITACLTELLRLVASA